MMPIPSTRQPLAAARMFIAALSLILATVATAGDSSLKVGFLTGGGEDHPFWTEMDRFAGAVAEDLNIDLEVEYLADAETGRAFLNTLDKGDYFVTVYMADISHEWLRTAEERGVRTFLINSDVVEKERADVGTPREKFDHWIGQMQPDDLQAGYRVADDLLAHFNQAKAAVKMIAINGDDHTQSAADRGTGLRQRLSESPGATLYAIEESNWSRDAGRELTAKLLEQYPDTNAIWTASDPITLGAAETVRAAGKEPGADIVLAGVDWTADGLAAVRAGDMLASVGGHFMEAGIALLLIYDYHHGRDFADDPGLRFKTRMYSIDRESIAEHYEKTGGSPDWSKINFKSFTKTHNPDLEQYDFSWDRISARL